jgi:hypothetical protein
MLPERREVVKQVKPATEIHATGMDVNSLILTALEFTKAQSADLRASLLFVWF